MTADTRPDTPRRRTYDVKGNELTFKTNRDEQGEVLTREDSGCIHDTDAKLARIEAQHTNDGYMSSPYVSNGSVASMAISLLDF